MNIYVEGLLILEKELVTFSFITNIEMNPWEYSVNVYAHAWLMLNVHTYAHV